METKTEVWLNGIPEVGQKAHRSRVVTTRDIELFTEISVTEIPCTMMRRQLTLLALVALWFKVALQVQS